MEKLDVFGVRLTFKDARTLLCSPKKSSTDKSFRWGTPGFGGLLGSLAILLNRS